MPGNRMKTTIEQKIIPAIVIAVSMILGALGTYTYLTAKSRLLDQAHQAIEATVGRLSTSLISPLWDLNNTGAQEFVTAEMRSREIISVVVRDNKNGLFAAKTRNTAGEIVDLTEVPKDTLPTSMRDVTKDGEKIGSIELHFTDEFVEKELRGMLVSTLASGLDGPRHRRHPRCAHPPRSVASVGRGRRTSQGDIGGRRRPHGLATRGGSARNFAARRVLQYLRREDARGDRSGQGSQSRNGLGRGTAVCHDA